MFKTAERIGAEDAAGPVPPSPPTDLDASYREHMAHALLSLRSEFRWLDGDRRLEIYQEVWTRLLERAQEGFWPNDVDGWLVGAVLNQARREYRQRRTRQTEPSDPFDGEITRVADLDMEEQVLGAADAESYSAIIATLSPPQRLVAKLRFDWGLSAREIAEVTGMERKRCYHHLERATARLRRGAVGVRDGVHARRYEKLLRSYIAGTATATQRAEAAGLVEHSSQARMMAAQMFRDARELGAVLPAPAFGDAHVRGGALELAAGVKQQALEVLAGAKQQTTAAYVRASELPQQVGQHASALRPGSAAAAIAGCLAIGGGTAVCLVEGVNPVTPLYDKLAVPGGEEKKEPREPAQGPAKAPPTAPAPQPAPTGPGPNAAPKPTPSPSPAPTPKPAAPPPSQAAPSPAGPQREFEFEQSRPSAPRTPAPAPSEGSGEFL